MESVLPETFTAFPVYVLAVVIPFLASSEVIQVMTRGGGGGGVPSGDLDGEADGCGVAFEMYKFDAPVMPDVMSEVAPEMP
jgi:hypothetical protein